MRHPARIIVAALLALGIGGEVSAQTSSTSTIVIEQPWSRATPKGAKTGAAYLTLVNKGASADALVAATTPLAEKVQFHKETEDNGVSRMQQVARIDLAPGAKISFKPGEMHMMIVGLKQPLAQGESFPLTLQFEKAGSVTVTVPIESVGAMQAGDMDSMMRGPGSDATMKK